MSYVFIGGEGAFGGGPRALEAAGLPPAAASGGAGDAAALLTEPGHEFAAVSLGPEKSFAAAALALERGLHVFCEPPFCRSVTEYTELLETAERAGRALFPAQPWEHSPSCRALEKAVTKGLTGEAAFAFCRLELPGPAPADWASSRAAWLAAALLLGAVRRPPAAVGARFLPDAASLQVHFGGCDGFIHLSAGAPRARLRVSVSGPAGALELDDNRLLLEPRGVPAEEIELSSAAVPGETRPDWLAAELALFRKEISGGAPRGSGLRNALHCVRLLKGAAASAATRSSAMPL